MSHAGRTDARPYEGFLRLVVLTGLACVAFSAWTALRLGGTTGTRVFDNLVLMVSAAVPGIVCIVAGRRRQGRDRLGWYLFGASNLSWAVGQGAWSYYQLLSGRAVPFPGIPDLGYLAAIPFAAAGLLAFCSVPAGLASRLRMAVDGLIITTAVLFVGWALVLGPAYRARSGNLLGQAVGLSYPTGYVAVLAIVAFVVAKSPGHRGLAFALVFAGQVGMGLASGAYALFTLQGTYYTGHPMDVSWMASFCLIGLGGWLAFRSEVTVPLPGDAGSTHIGIALPYLSVSVAAAVGISRFAGGTLGPFLAWDAVAAVVLIVARQLLTLVENASLTRGLETTVEARTRQLSQSEERFRSLVQHSTDMLIVVGADGRLRYLSPAVERLIGCEPSYLPDVDILQLVHPDDTGLVAGAIGTAMSTPGATAPVEFRIADATGQWRYVEVIGNNLLEHPAVGGLVLNGRDVTERRMAEEALAYQALHDPLTGLANRALLSDRLEMALARLERHSTALAVLFVDLDSFKFVNDSLGHHVGDRLLAAVAERFQTVLRPGDTVARFGGDEFVLLCEGLASGDGDEALAIAARVNEVLQAPLLVDGRDAVVTASIGIAMASGPGHCPESLLREADAAMYQAKALGRARHEVFDDAMRERAVRRLDTERDLRRAIEHEEFRAHYQPQLCLADGRVIGAEALVRWQHPQLGLVQPNDFIGVSEETGLIVEIGAWMLEETCRQARRWREPGGTGAMPKVAVNLAARQLASPGLVELVQRALTENGLDPSALSVEITESAVMQDLDAVIDVLGRLRDLGVEVGIDDFGTGYSSLSYLKRLPVSFLKIDRSFVAGLDQSPEGSTIVATIIRMAQSLGLTTIAEGVETSGQLEELLSYGCDAGQGYYWSRPLPANHLDTWLAEERAASRDRWPRVGPVPVARPGLG